MTQRQIRLYIDPPSRHFVEDGLFEGQAARYGGDDLMAPYRAVREGLTAEGVAVHTADLLPPESEGTLDLIVVMGFWKPMAHYRRLARRPGTVLSAYMPMECPIVDPAIYRAMPEMSGLFRRVLSWGEPDSLMPFTRSRVALDRFHWPQSFDDVHEELWNRADRGFLVMINTNKLPRLNIAELYTERLRALEFFERHGEIDLYGRYWERMPIRVGKGLLPWTLRIPLERAQRALWDVRQAVLPHPLYAAAARANRGPVDSKSEAVSRYDFAICFENMILPGWITEKLFDCFFVGTIPVYLGAPEILERVPEECFVDMRRFSGYSELRAFLKSLGPTERRAYRESARDFLRSSRFDVFRKKTFVDLFRRIVTEDARNGMES